ncbi:MAG: hypothetical protein J5I90_07580 [Caldilineales bacterium]|nr:hypothetical protein [Caldilineales bacterium]
MAALGWISFFVCLSCLMVIFVVVAIFMIFRANFRSSFSVQMGGRPRDGAIDADYELVDAETTDYTVTRPDSDPLLIPKDDHSTPDA